MKISPILAALGGGLGGLALAGGNGGEALMGLSPMLALLMHKKKQGAPATQATPNPAAPAAAPAAPGAVPSINLPAFGAPDPAAIQRKHQLASALMGFGQNVAMPTPAQIPFGPGRNNPYGYARY